MRLRLWWWREVREARISKSDRDVFERFGEAVIGNVLAGGLQPRTPELQKLYGDMGPTLKSAADWLTERGDSQEQREQRMDAVVQRAVERAVHGVDAVHALDFVL